MNNLIKIEIVNCFFDPAGKLITELAFVSDTIEFNFDYYGENSQPYKKLVTNQMFVTDENLDELIDKLNKIKETRKKIKDSQ